MPRVRENISLIEQIERARESGKIKLTRKEGGVVYALVGDGRYVGAKEIIEMLGESYDEYSKAALKTTISRANVELKKIRIEIVSRYKMGYLLRRRKTEVERRNLTEEQIVKYREGKRREQAKWKEKERKKAREIMESPSKEYLEQMKKLIDKARGEKNDKRDDR